MKIHEITMNRQQVAIIPELFGVEIEVENVAIPDTDPTIWTVIEDGSLRNNGFEFVTVPCTYDELTQGVEKFFVWFSQHNYQASIRTSTHVHYNVLNYDTAELAAALTVYSLMEPLLFRYCGQIREENIYCVPWYRAPQEARYVRALVEGRMSLVDLSCKYSALYLEPLLRFGTVEFRHAPVFTDAYSTMQWVDMVRAVMTEGRKFANGEEVINTYDDMGVDRFVARIFGSELMETLVMVCPEISFDSVMDEADSISIAEATVPSLYTYKVTDSWEPTEPLEGNLQSGYHNVRPAVILMVPDEPYPEDYEAREGDSESDYNEEEW